MADLKQLQQQRQHESRNKSKSSKGGWIWVVFVLIALLSNAAENSNLDFAFWRLRYWLSQNEETVIGLAVGIVLLVAAGSLVKAVWKRKQMEADHPWKVSRETRNNTASGRTSAAVRRPDPRNRSFTAPEAACIVCDHTGEDHFQRDKTNRIAQLDEWLKNGLIDKEEYKVLLSRYERNL